MLHHKARENYVEKSEEILITILSIGYDNKEISGPYNNPQDSPHISASLTEQNINNIKVGLVDGFGNKKGFTFFVEGKSKTITGQIFQKIEDLSEKIQKNSEYINVLSSSYISTMLQNWIELRVKTEIENDFISYLEENKIKDVKRYEVMVPLQYISTEKDFILGNVKFKSVSENMINNWISVMPKSKKDTQLYSDRLKQEMQGFIVASYIVNAEIEKAKEVAIKNISESLVVLRIFSPSNFLSQIKSYIHENLWNAGESSNTIFINPDENMIISHQYKTLDIGRFWTIEKRTTDLFTNKSYSGFNEIITIENKTPFQEDLFKALTIYSKHTLQSEIYDRLLYVLVALESLLIRNENESITQNLSDRVAFLISNDAQDRKEIVQKIRNIYKIRSNFVHHGHFPTDEYEKINDFLRITWLLFIRLVQNLDVFKTKQDLHNFIDHLKYQ